MNFKISSKKYHHLNKQHIRNRRAERYTRQFTTFEQNDLNDRTKYAQLPSPKGVNWRDYIRHRLHTMKKAVRAYTTEKYTHLRFDKYVETNRTCDKIAAMLVRILNCNFPLTFEMPCELNEIVSFLILFRCNRPIVSRVLSTWGGAAIPPNSPIRIRGNIRAPSNRKIQKSINKMRGNVVRKVPEDRTSRLCARCFEPFPLNTLSHRFKKCDFCWPDLDEWPVTLKLPEKIVTMRSGRDYKGQRKQMREALIVDHPNQPGGFVSKMVCYRKNWRQNAFEDLDRVGLDFSEDVTIPAISTIWHRDITAAKLILYKGVCDNCHRFGMNTE